jgi:pimeloyl-[acyl-carrier protein] methyl ester esterase
MPSASPPKRRHHALLLPGLDGTGLLFRPFTDSQPPQFRADVLAYPHAIASYAEAEELVASQLPADDRVMLIAESFSGPVAVRLAARLEHRISGVVLVASFVRSPVPALARALPWRVLFSVRPPAPALRQALLGPDCDASVVREMQTVLARLPGRTLALRVRSVLSVDASEPLRACRVPMLYVAGRYDRLVGARGLAGIHAVRPDVEHVIVDAPHLVLQRNPAAAWAAIERFAANL